MEFSRQEYWSGLPFLSPGDLPNPGIESRSLYYRRIIIASHNGNMISLTVYCIYLLLFVWLSTVKTFNFVIQFSSVSQSWSTLCNPTDCSTPGFPVHHQLPELIQTHVHRVSDAIHLILCRPLLLLPSIFPSIRVFSNESALHIRWP